MEKQAKLTLHRELPMSRTQAWAWFTDSSRTVKWFGPYRLEGEKFFVRMVQEEGQPEVEGRLVACENERMIRMRMGTDESAWEVQVELEDIPDGTRLTLSQAWTGGPDDPWLEAGWNFYLDCLIAATEGKTLPLFPDYARPLQEGK